MLKLFIRTSSFTVKNRHCPKSAIVKTLNLLPTSRVSIPLFTNQVGFHFSSNIQDPEDGGREHRRQHETSMKEQYQSLNTEKNSDRIVNEADAQTDEKVSGLSMDELIAFLQDKDSQHMASSRYTNKTVYALSDQLKNRPQIQKITFDKSFWITMYSIESVIWFPVTYFIYTSFSQVASIVPMLAWMITLAATRSAQKLMENSIMRLDLVDGEKVILYSWGNHGKGTTCRIEGATLNKVAKADDKQLTDSTEPKKSTYIEATFIEDSPKQRKVNGVFVISPDTSPIENISLFKDIIHGRHGNISKYQFEPKVEKSEE